MSSKASLSALAPPPYSLLPPPYHNSTGASTVTSTTTVSSRICCISLHESDKLRLIGTPEELVAILRETILKSWGKIQREHVYSGSYEFKVVGTPWSGQVQEAVKSRQLITAVLGTMIQHGWNLIQSADVSKKQGDKDSLFFESTGQQVDVIPYLDMFSISFNRTDRIRLIDAPPHIPAIVKEAIKQQWKQGISHERDYYNSLEFKLNGNPFYANGPETVWSRMMLSQVLAALRSSGYKLYTSVDISVGSGDGSDVHSWIFRRVDDTWS
ncbi:hypothetical protein EDD11_002093 [Mortierella claussenii]|nr:hypothetical protein EDD11_002093 [Mortierella claussenii]